MVVCNLTQLFSKVVGTDTHFLKIEWACCYYIATVTIFNKFYNKYAHVTVDEIARNTGNTYI